jgi:hypothetical protein
MRLVQLRNAVAEEAGSWPARGDIRRALARAERALVTAAREARRDTELLHEK